MCGQVSRGAGRRAGTGLRLARNRGLTHNGTATGDSGLSAAALPPMRGLRGRSDRHPAFRCGRTLNLLVTRRRGRRRRLVRRCRRGSGGRRPAAIRSLIVTRPTLPAVFRKLDAIAVLTGPLLPATIKRPRQRMPTSSTATCRGGPVNRRLVRPGPRAAPRGSRGRGVDDRNVLWILPRIERIYL